MKKEKPRVDSGTRIALAIAGVLAIIYGYGQILRNKPIYQTWTGQYTTASTPILVGEVMLVAAVLPWGHIGAFIESRQKKRKYR